jgi:hypothetical protein
MTLSIQVVDSNNNVRFTQTLVIDDDLFLPPNSDKVTLDGVRTAIDYQLYQTREEAKQT